jgi:hypothetical protein
MLSALRGRPLRNTVYVAHSTDGKCSMPCRECAFALVRYFRQHGRGKMLRVQYTSADGEVITQSAWRVLEQSKLSSARKKWHTR